MLPEVTCVKASLEKSCNWLKNRRMLELFLCPPRSCAAVCDNWEWGRREIGHCRAVLLRLEAGPGCCTILCMNRYISLGLLEEAGVTPNEPDVAPAGAACPVATLGDRCLAVVLDTIVLLAVFAVVDTWAFLRWSVPARAELNLTSASLLISATLNAVIFFVYLWLLEAAFGATLGKAMVGIRVQWELHGNYKRGALAASAIRNLLRVVDGLGFYLVGLVVASCSRLRQRVGDICAGTVVVAPELNAWTKALAIALWMGALAGSGWAVPRICAGNHGAHRLPYLGQVVAQLGRTDNSAYVRVARFKIEVQRNDDQFAPHAATRAASAPVPLAGSD
jgi:uncharacterized RDD family membrane protein YckC